MRRLFSLIYILAAAGSMDCFAQGVKFNYMLTSPVKRDPWVEHIPFVIGLGYEQNIGDKLSVGLDYNVNTAGLKNFNSREEESADYINDNYYYKFQFSTSEISYSSKYFFQENYNVAAYVSAGLAVQFIKYQWELIESYSTMPAHYKLGEYEDKATIIPLTLKLGYRSELEGIFNEFYMGLRFNMGNEEPHQTTFKYAGGAETKGVSFLLGAAWGIGWAK